MGGTPGDSGTDEGALEHLEEEERLELEPGLERSPFGTYGLSPCPVCGRPFDDGELAVTARIAGEPRIVHAGKCEAAAAGEQ